MAGGPGTRVGLSIRLARCLLAAASVAFIRLNSFPRRTEYTVFNLSALAMVIPVLWTFAFVCYDINNLRVRVNLQDRSLLTILAIGDWVTAHLTLAAAFSSLGVAIFLTRDTGMCQSIQGACRKALISGIMALASGLLSFFSALVVIRTRATLVHQE
ncbi:CASP-like protein 5B1 [Typha angustifolia]|uniref:CASP-like protein 5B1 n=1 Tax=Typha angustifolia TaxID=59011 RepID=UPI003C2D4A31